MSPGMLLKKFESSMNAPQKASFVRTVESWAMSIKWTSWKSKYLGTT